MQPNYILEPDMQSNYISEPYIKIGFKSKSTMVPFTPYWTSLLTAPNVVPHCFPNFKFSLTLGSWNLTILNAKVNF